MANNETIDLNLEMKLPFTLDSVVSRPNPAPVFKGIGIDTRAREALFRGDEDGKKKCMYTHLGLVGSKVI